tara:strand:- start:1790 stop:2494 length:705 start_codon:yes stop_codon:yes gene_type:complete
LLLNKIKYPHYYSYKGRKISKKLSLSKRDLINKFYDKFSLDQLIVQYHNSKYLKKKIHFSKKFNKINIEIGFGDGEFLIKNAISKPDELFFGVEVYVNGVASVLSRILDYGIKNIVLSNLNSYYFLKSIPNDTIDNIFIINPDPWIKKRHHKRRLMTCKVLDLLSKIIKSKQSIYMTTDSESYLNDTQDLLRNYNNFFSDFSVRILSNNDELYGISRYQRKAIEKGGKIYLLTF